jgi:hypothetical protein
MIQSIATRRRVNPATPKQFAFIKTLLAEREIDSDEQALVDAARERAQRGEMSTKDASGMIEWLMTLPKQQQSSEGGEQGGGDPEPGIYVHDDALYRVKISKAGHAYAQRWDDGTWEYVGRSAPFRSLSEQISAERAAEFGHVTGQCVFCMRELTDERSIAAGYGPVCADYYSLPWGGYVISHDDVPSTPLPRLAENE